MHPLLERLREAASVIFIVGYTKSTHDLAVLKRTLRAYQQYGFYLKVWPNYHAKIWKVGDVLYCGSQNFTPSFGPNYMVRSTDPGLEAYLRSSIAISSAVSASTKLELVPKYTMP